MSHVISNSGQVTAKNDFSDGHDGQIRKSVLFVCWANICRSPAGKSVLEKFIKRSNLQSIVDVDSAGVCVDGVGRKASLPMRWVTFRRGYRLNQKARSLSKADLSRFDLVIAMDQQILYSLPSFHSEPTSTIRLLSDYLPDDWPQDVPDPMNRSQKICHFIFDMFENACPNILAELFGESEDAPASRLSSQFAGGVG